MTATGYSAFTRNSAMAWHLPATFVVLFSITTSGPAQEGQAFFIRPITTDLHRELISATSDVYAAVNCSALVVNGEVDLASLEQQQFVEGLKELSISGRRLLLVLRFQSQVTDMSTLEEQLQSQLVSLCQSAGYENIRATKMWTTARWRDAQNRAAQLDETARAQEPIMQDEYVRVFPIQNRLSKFVLGDADCIVELIRPIDGRVKELAVDLQTSIKKHIQAANLVNKDTLLFKVSSTDAGRDRIEQLFRNTLPPKPPVLPKTDNAALLQAILKDYTDGIKSYRPSPALALAFQLGFKGIRYTHSPGGGAPETLIGRRLPDVALLNLDRNAVNLHQLIDGRPALITFWGLACGPCREEATHLTSLHQKYGSKGFSVIAVNAYDDDQESVVKYVQGANLSHPILLNGKAAAEEQFFVGSYPTTFWVDRNGQVIDYDVGCISSESRELRIRTMIGDLDK